MLGETRQKGLKSKGKTFKGIVSIEGANSFAWIDGENLFDCMTLDQNQIEFWRQQDTLIVWKVGDHYPELDNGRFAMRYPIAQAPDFNWCLYEVPQIELRMRVGYLNRTAVFLLPASELDDVDMRDGNFRTWAHERLRKWTEIPSDHNGLFPLLTRAKEMGWIVVEYHIPQDGGIRISPKSQRNLDLHYVLTLRKGGGLLHTVMAPDWVAFYASVEAAIDSLEELYESENLTEEDAGGILEGV